MKEILIAAFLNFAGPITFLAFLLWAHSLWMLYREPVEWKERGKSALWALAGTLIAFSSVTVDFKVLSDETNLLSVANMLALFGKASNTQMWTYYYHLFHALDLSVPTRPILFPMLTALVHAVAGVRPASPFVVNFLCLFGLFFLAIEWGRKRVPAGRLLIWLALLMSPVLLLVSTSAGFDLCSLFFGFASFLLLQRYARERDDRVLRALFLSLVCFASVRYESVVALPLVALGVWWIDRKKPFPLDLYATVALLVFPLFVQRYITWGSFENPPGVPAFSLSHLLKYFPVFLKAFFLEGKGAYPVVLHWLGLGGLALALLRPKRSELVALAYGLFLLVLLLCHHFGLADHPTQVRLFLPLSFALSLLGLFFLGRVGEKLDRFALAAVFAILFLHHHQFAMRDPLMSTLTMTREVRHIRAFLAEEGKEGDLHIYDRPGQLAALGKSAVSWPYFREHKDKLLTNLRNKLYQRILLVEKVRYKGPPEESSLIRDGYRLTPLREHQLSPEERLRISRVEWW